MIETVRYTYRLRPGGQAEAALRTEWGRCRWLWNEAVHQHRSDRTPTFARLSKLLTEARSKHAWLQDGSQVAQQQTLRTYAQAPHQSFTVKGRGRPVVKAKRRSLPSLEYTTRGFSIRDGRLVLPKGVRVRFVWSRDLPSPPTSVRVHQDTLGHWYASFVTRRETVPAGPAAGRIGIDWGVSTTATTTDPGFKPAFLAKSSLARTGADNAIGAAKATLIGYAERAGRTVVLVPPADPTMTCSACGSRAKTRLLLAERTFRCESRGYTAGRDRNAARVILAEAARRLAGADDVRHARVPPSEVCVGAVRAGHPPDPSKGKL